MCTNCSGNSRKMQGSAKCGCGNAGACAGGCNGSEAAEKAAHAGRDMEAMIDSLPMLICLLDDRNRILRANRSVGPWIRYPIPDLLGKPAHEALHPDCNEPACELRSWLVALPDAAGAPRHVERSYYDRIIDRYVSFQLRPLETGEAAAGPGAGSRVMWLQDITGFICAAPDMQLFLRHRREDNRIVIEPGHPALRTAPFEETLRRNASELQVMSRLLLQAPEIGRKADIAEMCEIIGRSLDVVGRSLETCIAPEGCPSFNG